MNVISAAPLVVYVDVDDTLIRTIGSKRIPVSGVAEHVRDLSKSGAVLYCWSTGGAEYAKNIATEISLADCFTAFLSKPNVLIDDQEFAAWRSVTQIHPLQCSNQSLESYRQRIHDQKFSSH